MQNIESSLVIATVCERLRLECPDVPLLTIHDSIATTREYADLVRQALLEGLHRLGVRPKVGQPEPWAYRKAERLSA
jgi:hypothetical protein